jgi:hypothetical protein
MNPLFFLAAIGVAVLVKRNRKISRATTQPTSNDDSRDEEKERLRRQNKRLKNTVRNMAIKNVSRKRKGSHAKDSGHSVDRTGRVRGDGANAEKLSSESDSGESAVKPNATDDTNKEQE